MNHGLNTLVTPTIDTGALLLILSIIRPKQCNKVKIILKSLDSLAVSKSVMHSFRLNLNNCP